MWSTVPELCREYGLNSATYHIERANRTIRYSWLSKYLFETINEVQDYATNWLWFYKNQRPHQANGGRPPLMDA